MSFISPRLRSLEPEIIAAVEATPPESCRKFALHIAEKAIQYAKIQDDPVVIAALQWLRAEKSGDSAEKQALIKLARALDDAALDIGEFLEQGKAAETEQTVAIAKARAADVLLSAFTDDSEEALADAVYEAYFAVDANAELIIQWLAEYR